MWALCFGSVLLSVTSTCPLDQFSPRVSDAVFMASIPSSRFRCAHIPISFSLPRGHVLSGQQKCLSTTSTNPASASTDPSTVYYALSVPKGDVGPTTDWSEHGDQPNRLHLTAVGQAVAFTLRALQTPPRDANWRTRALRQLKTWNVVVKDIEETIADDEVPSSEYRPSPGANSHIIRSPIQFRPRKKKSEVATCDSATSSFSSNDDNPPDTPSRPSQPSNSGSRPSTKSTAQTGERSGRKGALPILHPSTRRFRPWRA